MKVALVYDRVNKFGGAERVLKALHDIYPEAPLYTLVYDPPKAGWAKMFEVFPTFLNAIPVFRSKHELLAPVAPLAFETLNFDKYDLVISITSSDAKAIITKPRTMHVCYCLTPTRYYWSGEGDYKKDIKMRLLPTMIKKYLRTVDLLTSKRPDEYIAISNEVKKRIKKYYSRESSVVYPPIESKFFISKPAKKVERPYYLVVSRLVPYKRVDLVVDAFNKIKEHLIIVGSGDQELALKKQAGGTIEFVGQIEDSRLIEMYKYAKAVIFPQEEDYGLVPIEAQACGTPVIAYGKGGALETVIDGKTGFFFKNQTANSLIRSIAKFEKAKINYKNCTDQAKNFNSKTFSAHFTKEINKLRKRYYQV